MNVTVVGLGKLGTPLAAVLANAGHAVRGIDLNRYLINQINRGIAPVEEPHLQELLDELPRGQFTASEDYSVGLDDSDISFIIVPTPSGDDGMFSNKFVLDAVRDIGANLPDKWHTVVVCSTVMPGSTGGVIKEALEESSGRTVGDSVGLIYSPEFIALGSVIHDMRNPDMVLVGSEDDRSSATFKSVVDSYLFRSAPFTVMSYTEAELAKISVNTFITMKISYANTIGALAEELDIDASKVLNAVGTDTRIGNKYLRSGASYGGPCFPRDTVAFNALGQSLKVATPLAIATSMVNKSVIDRITRKLKQYEIVAILGVTYKPDTGVTEESMGLKLQKALSGAGVMCLTHDPIAKSSYADAQRCVDNAAAVIICTPYSEYASLDFGSKLVVDPWNICPLKDLIHANNT